MEHSAESRGRRSVELGRLAGTLLVATLLASASAGAQQGTLFVREGKVGIGHPNPHLRLSISGSDGDTALRLAEESPSVAFRTLATLVNNGGVRLQLRNTDAEEAWFVSIDNEGRFFVSRDGTGGRELVIQKDGRVGIGPGPAVVFNLNQFGDLAIDGTLTEGSSREAKRDIEPVDAAELLARLLELPLARWSYRHDSGARHLGPMAEDFHRLFGLGGEPTHIAPRDLASVALAAVQALQREAVERERRFEEERTALLRRLESLERAVARLPDGAGAAARPQEP